MVLNNDHRCQKCGVRHSTASMVGYGLLTFRGIRYCEIHKQFKRELLAVEKLVAGGEKNAKIIGETVFPDYYEAMPALAVGEAEKYLTLVEDLTMATATAKAKEFELNFDALEDLTDAELKQTAKQRGLSTRGRFNRNKLTTRVLATCNGEVVKINLGAAEEPVTGPRLAEQPADDSEPEETAAEESEDQAAGEGTRKLKDIKLELWGGKAYEAFAQALKKVITTSGSKDPNPGDNELRRAHPHLDDAEFTIFMRFGWPATANDGKMKFAQIKIATEEQRLMGYGDLIVHVNYSIFGKGTVKAALRDNVLDTLCSQIRPKLGKDGQQDENKHGHRLWQKINPPVAVFPDVVARRGFATADEVKLANAVREAKVQTALFGD